MNIIGLTEAPSGRTVMVNMTNVTHFRTINQDSDYPVTGIHFTNRQFITVTDTIYQIVEKAEVVGEFDDYDSGI